MHIRSRPKSATDQVVDGGCVLYVQIYLCTPLLIIDWFPFGTQLTTHSVLAIDNVFAYWADGPSIPCPSSSYQRPKRPALQILNRVVPFHHDASPMSPKLLAPHQC